MAPSPCPRAAAAAPMSAASPLSSSPPSHRAAIPSRPQYPKWVVARDSRDLGQAWGGATILSTNVRGHPAMCLQPAPPCARVGILPRLEEARRSAYGERAGVTQAG